MQGVPGFSVAQWVGFIAVLVICLAVLLLAMKVAMNYLDDRSPDDY